MNQCPTGKISYPTKGAAITALTRMRKDKARNNPRTETKTYLCPHCQTWHLSSTPTKGGLTPPRHP